MRCAPRAHTLPSPIRERVYNARAKSIARLENRQVSSYGSVGERVQASLLKTLLMKILLLHQCVWASGSGPKTHTLTLSLVRGPGQGEGIQKDLASDSTPALFTPFAQCN